ncbi:MAG TPA: helix-turn-helix domain-containing protein [Candidatus Baltobacteraceae bacterium]
MNARVASGTQSLERMGAILRAVAAGGALGMRLSEIADATGLNAATAHRMLGVLTLCDIVEHDESRLYFPGPAMLRFGEAAEERYRISRIGRGPIRQLCEFTQDIAYVLVRRNADAICVLREAGGHQTRSLAFSVGIRDPLGGGTGSIPLLAYLGDAEIERILDANAHLLDLEPGFSRAALRRHVADVRTNGHLATEGRLSPGLCVFAFPIAHGSNPAVAALSVFVQAPRLDRGFRTAFLSEVRKTVAAIQDGLSGEFPGAPPKTFAKPAPARKAVRLSESPARSHRIG